MTWQLIAEWWTDCIPKGQPRPRAFVKHNGHAGTYNPETAKDFKSAIAFASVAHRPATPLVGPVKVSWVAHLPRPKCLMRRKDPDGSVPHCAKPDRDNIDKAILDSMTNCGWWRDDTQVCSGLLEKVYHAKSSRPGVLIRVYAWDAAGATATEVDGNRSG